MDVGEIEARVCGLGAIGARGALDTQGLDEAARGGETLAERCLPDSVGVADAFDVVHDAEEVARVGALAQGAALALTWHLYNLRWISSLERDGWLEAFASP